MSEEPKQFTLGFILNASKDKVLLIHKNRPTLQSGKVNGLGGKVEPSESLLACIVREVKEESGLVTEESQWIPLGALRGTAWIVHVFGYIYEGDMADAKTLEDEEVEWFDIKALPQNAMSNVPWLLSMLLDKLGGRGFEEFVARYAE